MASFPRTSALRSRASLGSLWLVWVLLAIWATAQMVLATYLTHFPYDVTIARLWQHNDPAFLGPFLLWLNESQGELQVLLPALLITSVVIHRNRLVLLLLPVPLVAHAANSLLKGIIERPRPSPGLVEVTERAGSFSFPSGHVMTSVILFGLMFVILDDVIHQRTLRRAAQAACLVVIVLMGPARVYSGAHWPSDVVAGYVFGALVLLPIVWAYRTYRIGRPSGRLSRH